MIQCTRIVAMAVIALVVAPLPSRADVTVKSKMRGRGLGMTAEGETVTSVKGLKMRSDVTVRGQQLSTIVDLDAEQFISLNHQTREAEVYDMRSFVADLRKIAEADVTVNLAPTGQQRQILGQTCEEYTVGVAVRVSPNGQEEMTVMMRGPVWVSPGSPARPDWARFYTAAADKGLFFTDPRATRADPGRVRGMTTLYRRLAELGVPYVTEIDIRVEGSGPTAALVSKMGSSSMTNEVTEVSTETIPGSLFAIPSGYQIKKK